MAVKVGSEPEELDFPPRITPVVVGATVYELPIDDVHHHAHSLFEPREFLEHVLEQYTPIAYS